MPLGRVMKLLVPLLLLVELPLLLFVVVEPKDPTDPPVMALIVPLTQRPLARMKGKLHKVQLFPSELHCAQNKFLVEQGLQTPLLMKKPSLQAVHATLARQFLQPMKICEQVWQVTLKGLLTR